MYGPAPVRPKKTSICRTRTGCQKCRQRRKKCDEQKPVCGTCKRLKVLCEPVSSALAFRDVVLPIQNQNAVPPNRTIAVLSPPKPGSGFVPGRKQYGSNHDPELKLRQSKNQPSSSDTTVTSPVTFTLALPQNLGLAVRFHIGHWAQTCEPAMPLSLRHLSSQNPQTQPLVEAIMATISACRLSRGRPTRKLFEIPGTKGTSFRPDIDHECLSSELYGSALQQLAVWTRTGFDANPGLSFTILILFCYLASSMGNFTEFRLHSEAMEGLMTRWADQLVQHRRGLLAAVVEIQLQTWWRRNFFNTPDGALENPLPLLCSRWETASASAEETRRASVLSILCESQRVNKASIVSRWAEQAEQNAASESPTDGPVLASNESEMRALSERLDAWHASLPVTDLPLDTSGELLRHEQYDLPSQPLRFSSHFAAMNYAYFVTARALQCTVSPNTVANGDQDVEWWISRLLGVTASVDWDQCIRCNTFTIGLTGLLLVGTFCSRSLATGSWIQAWLEERLENNDFEEGNFPIFQILDAVRLINRKRKDGQDVAALFQTVDDGGGSGKFGSYHSQSICSLLVYTRRRSTGRLESYIETM